MSDVAKKDLVLRTVYLPRELDAELRELAYKQNVSKGELIRSLIAGVLGDTPTKKTAANKTTGKKTPVVATSGKTKRQSKKP